MQSLKSLQAKGADLVKQAKKMGPKKQKTVLLGIIGFSISALALSLFSIYTITAFLLFVASAGLYAKIEIDSLRKKGLIHFLPKGLKSTLTQRSIFDVICDVWFFPKIAIYIKAMVAPFIYKIDPQEAIHQFRDTSPGFRKAITTKGVVNIMPSTLKSVLLPKHEMISEESSDVSSEGADEEMSPGPKHKKSAKEIIFNETSSSKSQHSEIQINSNHKNQNASTDDEQTINSLRKKENENSENPLLKEINSLQKWGEDMKVFKEQASAELEPEHKHKGLPRKHSSFSKIPQKSFKDEPTNDDKDDSLGPIIAKKKSSKVVVSDKWDKLELYAQKSREGDKKPTTKKAPLRGALQILDRLGELSSKDAILRKLSQEKLFKIFIVSTLVLVIQLGVSKKTRQICYHTLHVLMYVLGFVVSTGSLGLFVLKLKQNLNKTKQPSIKDSKKEQGSASNH